MNYRKVKTPLDTGTYGAGRFVMRTDVDFSDDLRTFITEQSFLDDEAEREKRIVYRRHRKFEFPLPFGSGCDAIMKISWPSPDYPWHRRLQLVFKQRYVEDYCETAFYGALALEDADIPTHKVLAFWTRDVSLLRTDSYLIYEKIVADRSGHDLMLACREPDATDAERNAFSDFLEQLAGMVAKLHTHGLRHGDIADHNFLVRTETGAPEDVPTQHLFMIDTDCVKAASNAIPFLKRMHDIRDWRIIDLAQADLRRVLKSCLGDGFREWHWRLLKFYRSPWYRPIRTLRYLIKGKPLKDPYHLND